MKKEQTVYILDSLIEMTRYRDRELIAASLVKTLYDFASAEKIELYAVHKTEEPVILNLLARIDAFGVSSQPDTPSRKFSQKPGRAIIQCLEKREVVLLENGKEKKIQVIFPVVDNKGSVSSLLITHCSRSNPEFLRLTEGILRLYHNYLSLLEDSQRDRLTGLLNRETFISEINKIISERKKKTKEIFRTLHEESILKKNTHIGWDYWISITLNVSTTVLVIYTEMKY